MHRFLPVRDPALVPSRDQYVLVGLDPVVLDDSVQKGYSGGDSTGFGLAIVESIVDAHGWKIGVTEGADGGARFEIVHVKTRT